MVAAAVAGKKMSIGKPYSLFAIFLFSLTLTAQGKRIVVAKDGSGDFNSIQQAINSLPDASATPNTIFIKDGTYDEKLFLEKSNVILAGEDKNKVVITQSIARDAWRCDHADDWGVATLNLRGSDITLSNLSIENNYGFVVHNEQTISCTSDSTHQKKVRPDGHQM